MKKMIINAKIPVLFLFALLTWTNACCQRDVITIPDFPATGLILDIGGGGEGVIGQLKGDQVISIDINKQELIDAPSINLKLVMDARDLKFLDNSFNTVAIFYTLMYIKGADHEKVFSEVYRVLKPGGKLLIWDVDLPPRKGATIETIMYSFSFKLPNTTINTGYGVRKQEKEQNLQYYTDLAVKTGFKVISSTQTGSSLYLELQKNQ
ncbi:MAG: class I SAM-dependent methyltransferase [Bacteroidales bacterium]|nr:MAG: class I SAM-dependent methyltransferase [Bacteroidales bacterium]